MGRSILARMAVRAMRCMVLLAIACLAIAHGVSEQDYADLDGNGDAMERSIEQDVRVNNPDLAKFHINSGDQEDRIDEAMDSDFPSESAMKSAGSKSDRSTDPMADEMRAIQGARADQEGRKMMDAVGDKHNSDLGAAQSEADKESVGYGRRRARARRRSKNQAEKIQKISARREKGIKKREVVNKQKQKAREKVGKLKEKVVKERVAKNKEKARKSKVRLERADKSRKERKKKQELR